jgi:hypothetical protein
MADVHADRYDPRPFIASVEWVFAKTMAAYNPHEYVVEKNYRGAEFDSFVAFIRSAPIRRYRGGRYFCAEVDDWTYFLTHAGAAGYIVNRKPTERAGWDPEPPPSHEPAEIIWHDVERGLLTQSAAEKLLADL